MGKVEKFDKFFGKVWKNLFWLILFLFGGCKVDFFVGGILKVIS